MTADTQQPEALRLARWLRSEIDHSRLTTGLTYFTLTRGRAEEIEASLIAQHAALAERDAEIERLMAEPPNGWRDIVEQLIACHEEPTCPAVTLAREWLAAALGEPVAPWRQTGDELAMDPDGWVALDWAPGEDMLSVSISRDGTACFALIAAGERRNGTFEVPPQFFQVLRAAYLAREADPPPPAPTAAPPKGWQPIDSAPKDHTEVILFAPAETPQVFTGKHVYGWSRSSSGGFASRDDFFGDGEIEATHWQPLPDPPSTHPQTAGKGSTHHG